jgi:hypothetical protein
MKRGGQFRKCRISAFVCAIPIASIIPICTDQHEALTILNDSRSESLKPHLFRGNTSRAPLSSLREASVKILDLQGPN